MGGVINIVTRKMHDNGVNTNIHMGYGSYNTLESEFTSRIRKGRFSSVVSGRIIVQTGIVIIWSLNNTEDMQN